MLSLKDCLDFCDLDCREIEAIAEHEHVPLIVAMEMSSELVATEEGLRNMHTMMRDDIEHALEIGNLDHATELTATYLHFCKDHPLPPSGPRH